MRKLLAVLLVCVLALPVSGSPVSGKKVRYAGGTLTHIPENAEGFLDLTADAAVFQRKDKRGQAAISYDSMDSLEYGQQCGRRVGLVIAAGPLFLFSKKRKHFLSITFTDQRNRVQGAVFELSKGVVKQTLSTLETRTGLRVEYESEEARKFAEKN